MKKILITRKLMKSSEEYALKIFNVKLNKKDRLLTKNELISNSSDCDGILSSLTEKFDADIISKLSDKVKIISNFAVGFGNIDLDEAKKKYCCYKYSRCFNRRNGRNCDTRAFRCCQKSQRRNGVD